MSYAVHRAVRAARIEPAPLKFVAAELALCAGSDDGGEIHPSLATLAAYCSISRDQARRHVQALVKAGILVLVKPATPRSVPRYRMDLGVLARLPRSGVDASRGSTHATPEVAPMPPHNEGEGLHGCHPRGSTHATQTPPEPKVQGRGSAAGAAGRLTPAAAAAPLSYPSIGDRALWAELHTARKRSLTQDDLDAWGEQAAAALAAGCDVDAGIRVLINKRGFKDFQRVGGPVSEPAAGQPPRASRSRRQKVIAVAGGYSDGWDS